MPQPLDICVIEDDEDARTSLVRILKLDQHRTTTFDTADDAIAHGFANFDVVLMDRRLPDGLAEELLPKLRSLAGDTDFIVITGYADLNAAIAALREGVADYLIKPIDPDALRSSLTRLARSQAMARELYRQRRFAEKLLDTAEAIVLVLDTKGKVLRANQYLLELSGYSLDEVIEADWFDVFIPEDERDRIRNVFERTVQQLVTRGVVNPILTKDGSRREVRWSNSTLRNSDGKTTAVLSVGLDVTEFVKAQEDRLKNERLAAIGQTMAGLAHESRNALQRLQNAVDLLQEELVGQPVALKDLNKIERAGKHIHDLLEEVREYAAPIVLNPTHQSVPVIWRQAWESVAHRTKDLHVDFLESLANDASDDDLRASVDARRIEQVFRNLFKNALDAVDGEVHITVSCAASAGKITIHVRDNGWGIPVSQRDTLFDAFSTSKPTGTGLGLAICKRIIEAHIGTLQLVPSETGANFLIELPKRGVQ